LKVIMVDQESSSSADATQVKSFPPLESVGDIMHQFAAVLPAGGSDKAQRMEWASMLARLMVRVAQLRLRKARGRNIAHLLARLAAGVTAAVTTVTGGTLLAHAHGRAASVLGLTAVILGVLGAAVAAVRPGESYTADLLIAAQYEHLWWDMYSFGITELATIAQEDFLVRMGSFLERQEDINSKPAAGAQ
jgi:hypothetical protein